MHGSEVMTAAGITQGEVITAAGIIQSRSAG